MAPCIALYPEGLRDHIEEHFAAQTLAGVKGLRAELERFAADVSALGRREPDLAEACRCALAELADLLDDWWHDHFAALEGHLERVIDDFAERMP